MTIFVFVKHFSEYLGAEHTLFVLDPTRTFIGGLNSPTLSRRRRDKKKDFVGCINDVRFNGHLLHYFNGTRDIGNARSIGKVNNVFVLICLCICLNF